MKKLLLTLAALLTMASVQAKIVDGFYLIDMTGKNFASEEFNMYDDGISGEFDAFAIVLDGKISQDFTTATEATNEEGECSLHVVKATAKQTVLEVVTDLEVDSGDYCNITIKYKNGKKATLGIYATGT